MGSRQLIARRATLLSRAVSYRRREEVSACIAFPAVRRASIPAAVRQRWSRGEDALVLGVNPFSQSVKRSGFRRQSGLPHPRIHTNRKCQASQCRRFSATGTNPKLVPLVDGKDDVDDDDAEEEEDCLPFLGGANVPDDTSTREVGEDNDAAPEGLFLKNTPLYELNFHYKNLHGIGSVSSQIHAESQRTAGNFLVWSAVFRCPVSSVEYPSGTLRAGPWPVNREAGRKEGKVYYAKKQAAVHAAAARALDVIQYGTLGIVEPRLCEEDPSVPIVEPADGQPEVEVPSVERSSVGTAPDAPPTAQPQIRLSALDDRGPKPESETDGEDVNDWEEVESEDEAESLMEVVWVPVATRERPPSHRILDALSSGPSNGSDSASLENERVPLTLNPVQQLNVAVGRANDWADAQQHRRQRKARNAQRTIIASGDSSSQVLDAGKVILRSLAEAKQNLPVTSMVYKVEDAATRVLGVLQSASSSGSESLDAEVYTFYLKCLEDPSPLVVARRGEELVSKMRAGESMNGSILPKPTIHTINALIQLHAQVGGTTGRYDCSEDDFRPNKESFLGILSSLIYRPLRADEYRGFDVDFCRKCIKRMTELADETGDETLRPDTQVYNAPLRWYGGSQFRRSRPYARVLRADSFERRFSQGLLEKGDISMREAIEMEAWLDAMRDSSDSRIKPDIETYEAIIQGWIRTATRQGLERAHAIAEALLDRTGVAPPPRLQTFRPLVIAWALSSEPDAPLKIQELLDSLCSAGENTPELLPDVRMQQYLIASHVRTQSALQKKASSSVLDSSDCEAIVRSAKAVDQILKELCASALAPDFDGFLEITPFEHAVCAWRNAALASIAANSESEGLDSVGNPSTFEGSIRSMMDVRQLFDETLQTMKSREVQGYLVVGNQATQKLSPQLMHLLRFAHRVHSTVIVSLLKVDAKLKVACSQPRSSSDLLVRHLTGVDSMLRTSAECKFLLELVARLGSDSKLSSLKARSWAGKPPEPSVAVADLPHGHYIPATRLTYPDEMSLVDLQLLPGWTQDAFVRYGVKYVRSIALDEGGDVPVCVRVGDLVRLLVVLQHASSSSSGSSLSLPSEDGKFNSLNSFQRRARDDVQKVLSQLMPFLQDQQPWRRMTSAITRARSVGSGRGVIAPATPRRSSTSRRPRPPKRARRATASL